MLQNMIYALWHLPMVRDFVLPLALVAILCIVLYWEGEYGHPDVQ